MSDQMHGAEKDACENPHGADGVVACCSPGGPCPAGQTVCESCGPCYLCRPGDHPLDAPIPPGAETDQSDTEQHTTSVLPPGQCPACGKPIYVAAKWSEWACSDPECVNAHGPGPGGGHVIPPAKTSIDATEGTP